jgi:hypothetical protein
MKIEAKQRLMATGVADQIKLLKSRGFYVEDMGKESGPEFKGQYRWMNSKTDEFQDSEESYSKDDAWSQCIEDNL